MLAAIKHVYLYMGMEAIHIGLGLFGISLASVCLNYISLAVVQPCLCVGERERERETFTDPEKVHPFILPDKAWVCFSHAK